MLSSNSYDLVRPPVTPPGAAPDVNAVTEEARRISGAWDADLAEMCVTKVFQLRPGHHRRLTTGQIADAILQDEDYIEVLRAGGFEGADLQEARVTAADVALETRIGEQLHAGPCPNLAELQWRKHRRAAVTALLDENVDTRVATTTGRVRS